MHPRGLRRTGLMPGSESLFLEHQSWSLLAMKAILLTDIFGLNKSSYKVQAELQQKYIYIFHASSAGWENHLSGQSPVCLSCRHPCMTCACLWSGFLSSSCTFPSTATAICHDLCAWILMEICSQTSWLGPTCPSPYSFLQQGKLFSPAPRVRRTTSSPAPAAAPLSCPSLPAGTAGRASSRAATSA